MTYEGPPPRWKKYLHVASRSQSFLWKTALGFIAAGVALGYLMSARAPGPALSRAAVDVSVAADKNARPLPSFEPASQAARVLDLLEAKAAGEKMDFVTALQAMTALPVQLTERDLARLRGWLTRHFTTEEAEFGLALAAAWNLENKPAYPRLVAMADAPGAVRGADFAVGLVELKRNDPQSAYRRFARENSRAPTLPARQLVVRALQEARDFKTLASLEHTPGFAEMFTPQLQLTVAMGLRDWSTLVPLVLRLHFTSYQTAVLVFAIVGGFAWAFFLAHLGEWPRVFSTTAMLCLAGLVCGVASTVPALFASLWQDAMLGFAPGTEPPRVLGYFVAGVGLREEVSKLLLVVPLLPFLLRRDDELEVLVVSSFVGLGFAIQESASAFMKANMASAGHFLSSNFFHLALTGVNGLALYRACRWGMRGMNELLFVLPVTIVAHGLHDGLGMLPALDEGGYLSMVVYVLFCFFYFRRAHELRGNVRMTISLTGAFVFGMSLLAAAAIVHYMSTFGAGEGAGFFFTEAIASGIVVILFLRVFNEPLHP